MKKWFSLFLCALVLSNAAAHVAVAAKERSVFDYYADIPQNKVQDVLIMNVGAKDCLFDFETCLLSFRCLFLCFLLLLHFCSLLD